MRTLYLAQPIDQAPRSDWRTRATELSDKLSRIPGVAVFRPALAWQLRVGEDGPDLRIEAVNRAALDAADAVVAILPAGVASVGVPREIEYMRDRGGPVAVLTDLTYSMSLADCDLFPITDQGVADLLHWFAQLPPNDPSSTKSPLLFQVEGRSFLPTQSHPGDAGFDLYVSQHTLIMPGQFADVPCGVRVALPPQVWAYVVGRSSTLRKRGLLVASAVIDAGYRGDMFVGVQNLGQAPIPVTPGERLAQMILHPVLADHFEPLIVSQERFESLPATSRGTDAFGSTGGWS